MSERQIGIPVFICGYPKSGTTLLLALLDRHPQLLVFPEESKYFKLVLDHPNRCNPEYILTHTGAKSLRLGEFRYTSGYRDYSGVDFEAFQSFLITQWSAGEQSEPGLLETLMDTYGHATHQTEKKYWVEKTPLNERYLKRVDSWWPDLRAIYILRDPRDNYCSYRRQKTAQYQAKQGQLLKNGTKSSSKSNQQNSDNSKHLLLDEFIAYWLESINAWRNFSRRHSQCLLIRYDDLVLSPRTEMGRICEFLEISWDDTLLEPTRNGSLWTGNSMYGTKFAGVSKSSLGRYKKELVSEEIKYLDSWLYVILESYGWATDSNLIPLNALLRRLVFSGNTKPYIIFKLIFEQLILRSTLKYT